MNECQKKRRGGREKRVRIGPIAVKRQRRARDGGKGDFDDEGAQVEHKGVEASPEADRAQNAEPEPPAHERQPLQGRVECVLESLSW